MSAAAVHNRKGVNDSHQMSDANSLNCLKERARIDMARG